MGYAELRVRTCYSFLEGSSLPEELCRCAAELGLAGLGLADRGTLSGAVRMHRAARHFGQRLAVGAEVELPAGAVVVLLALDRGGYGHLCRILTAGRRRSVKGMCRVELEDLSSFSGGLLALILDEPWSEGEAGVLRDVFEDRVYLLTERHLRADDDRRLAFALGRGRALGCPVVASNGVRYHRRERARLLAVMTAIRHRRPLGEVGRRVLANAERGLKSPAAMGRLFAGAPGVVERSVEVLERCCFSLDELRYEYPEEGSEEGESLAEVLARRVRLGLRERYPGGAPADVRALVERELRLIEELGYEPYFLTVDELVGFARSRGILCQGRGSAANSAVCYCLGITEVDPRRHQLLFERFISAERGEPPDIDVDFEHERREEVIQYVYERYGRDRAGMTASVRTYRRRSALREVGAAFALSRDSLDRLVGASQESIDGRPAAEDLRRGGFDPSSSVLSRVLELSEELMGFPRHLSQHVGGMVITRGRLDELVPIENAAMEGRTVIEWDKDDLDALGLLKIDLLGLGMLAAIRRALMALAPAERVWEGACAARRGLSAIMASDPEGAGCSPQARAVYDMLGQADTVGVFQIESRAQMAMLPRLKPRCFYDLVIEVAIVRPGPIQGRMVNPYLERRAGRRAVEYPHPCTRPVLERTLGVPLFQEQVMQLAVVAAGFTPAEADGLRRAMGAWRKRGLMEDYRQRLLAGFAARGIDERFARQIYDQIAGFGEYGFPESHAASFALLVYASAWLKRFQPAAFAAALLNSQPMGFYPPRLLVRDAREHGVELRGVDVNHSEEEWSLEGSLLAPEAVLARPPHLWGAGGPALRVGLRAVKGLGEESAAALVSARRRGGAFRSVSELRRRAGLDRRAMQALARADALGSLGFDRRGGLWESLADENRQLPLFADLDEPRSSAVLPRGSEREEIRADLERLGLSLRRHPLALIRGRLREEVGACSVRDLRERGHGARLRLAGLVSVRQRPGTARGVMFLTIEDEFGDANLILPPRVAERDRVAARRGRLLVVEGRVERVEGVLHVIAEAVRALPESWLAAGPGSRDFR